MIYTVGGGRKTLSRASANYIIFVDEPYAYTDIEFEKEKALRKLIQILLKANTITILCSST